MNSLREELGGGQPGVPDFRLMLPPGWTTYDTTERTEKELLAKARERLRQAHRPDAYAILAGHVERALAAARKQGAFMMIMAGDDAPSWSTVPVSILGTITQGTPEVSLDRMVADAIERRGARALDGSRHFLRWSDERTVELTGESLGAHTVVYLTPVPGTNRRKALQLTATLAHPVDVDPTTDPQMAAWLQLLDGCIATFAWTSE
ncbi:hypothetical protein [Microbacterium pumilum]|uniref:Uncharacterized protein n=1 Tax=Microbacterium pumilum TaxID=344165 RepID=A0ABN2SDF2_9MICO